MGLATTYPGGLHELSLFECIVESIISTLRLQHTSGLLLKEKRSITPSATDTSSPGKFSTPETCSARRLYVGLDDTYLQNVEMNEDDLLPC